MAVKTEWREASGKTGLSCLSTDTKPDAPAGSICWETDTGNRFERDGDTWQPNGVGGAASVVEQSTNPMLDVFYQKLSWPANTAGPRSTADMSAYRYFQINVVGFTGSGGTPDTWHTKMYIDPSQTVTSLITQWQRSSSGAIHTGASSLTGLFLPVTGASNMSNTYLPQYGLEITKTGTTDGVCDIYVYGVR